jgi:hypothetical protein
MIGLPDEFLSFSDNSKGGGVMQVMFRKQNIIYCRDINIRF